jgi:ammonia channel protein AmtB
MYYQDPDKVAWIRKLLNLIETYIYGLPGLRDEQEDGLDLSQAADDDILHQQFQTFQGAYLIIVAQYFSGGITARWRVRQQRFSRVLMVRLAYRLHRRR